MSITLFFISWITLLFDVISFSHKLAGQTWTVDSFPLVINFSLLTKVK